MSNAIKFTEKGGIRVEARLESERKNLQVVRMTVSDTGIGISPDHHEDVFQAFMQIDASITRRFGGTGLGLAISRQLAKLIDADLAVVSEPGCGSTFTLTVPLRKTCEPEKWSKDSRIQHTAVTSPCNILVVEDDDATRLVTIMILSKAGHYVEAVESGYHAMKAVADFTPDIVVMDISLPGMDGIETTKRLRAALAQPNLPVIAMSAHVFKGDVERHLRSGMDAFVAKPIVHKQLLEAIARRRPLRLPSRRSPPHSTKQSTRRTSICSASIPSGACKRSLATAFRAGSNRCMTPSGPTTEKR